MNGVIGRSCDDSTATIPCPFQQLRDLRVTAIPGHRDQAAVVQAVPLRIGTSLEEELHRFGVSFAHGKMNRRGVPILRTAEPRIVSKGAAEGRDVTVCRRGKGVPDDLPLRRFELVGFD